MLYERFTKSGTLSEPKGVPEPQWALKSTIYWMKSLQILCEHEQVTFAAARADFGKLQRIAMCSQRENTIFEQLLLSLHHLSALEALISVEHPVDVARTAIITWYYGIYCAASAMIAAQDGSQQQKHGPTAVTWDRQIVCPNNIRGPFGFRVSTLVEAEYLTQIRELESGVKFALVRRPVTIEDARGAACAYLAGTAKWYSTQIGLRVKQTKAFEDLAVADFRSKAAKDLRDRQLAGKPVGFLHQAIRYRGKANYREALYLSYGPNAKSDIGSFIPDMAFVLAAFLSIAAALSAARLGTSLWTSFIVDLDLKRSFSRTPHGLFT